MFEKGALKRIEELIKLVKSVYPTHCYYARLTEETSAITTYPEENPEDIFKKSFFMFVSKAYIPEEWDMLHINIDNMILAIKDKVTGWDLKETELIFEGGKSETSFIVAKRELNEDHSRNHISSILIPDPIDGDAEVYKEEYGIEIINRLLDYQVLSLRPNTDLVDDVAVIVTRKCFPNIKKMNSLNATWYTWENNEIIDVELQSTFLDKNPVMFHHRIKAIRC